MTTSSGPSPSSDSAIARTRDSPVYFSAKSLATMHISIILTSSRKAGEYLPAPPSNEVLTRVLCAQAHALMQNFKCLPFMCKILDPSIKVSSKSSSDNSCPLPGKYMIARSAFPFCTRIVDVADTPPGTVPTRRWHTPSLRYSSRMIAARQSSPRRSIIALFAPSRARVTIAVETGPPPCTVRSIAFCTSLPAG